MSVTTEHLAVYLWLMLMDERLPAYICRVYAHDLQTKSLKEIQPQIVESMDSLSLRKISAFSTRALPIRNPGVDKNKSKEKRQVFQMYLKSAFCVNLLVEIFRVMIFSHVGLFQSLTKWKLRKLFVLKLIMII